MVKIMKKNKIRKILLIRVLLLSTLIFAVCTAPIVLFSTQNNKQETSEIIEQENPHTSGYKLDWAENDVLICDVLGDQCLLKICRGRSGSAIIAWEDHRTPGPEIYVQKVAANGTTMWDDDGKLICNSMPSGDKIDLQICDDGYGGAYVTWTDDRPGSLGTDIYAQHINENGVTSFEDNGTVICNASDNQFYPKIYETMDSATITWQDERTGLDIDIYAQKFDIFGTIDWDENGIVICNAIGDQVDVQITDDWSGGAFIAWADTRYGFYDIYLQHIDGSGTTMWNNGTSICNSTFIGPEYDGPHISNEGLAICGDNDHGAYIVWIDNRSIATSDYDIYAQSIDQSKNIRWEANGTVICNATDDQEEVRICDSDDGDAVIVWNNGTIGNDHIYAQKVTPDKDLLWGEDGVVVSDELSGKGGASICYNEIGGVILTWDDDRNGDDDIYAQKLGPNGSLLWGENAAAVCTKVNDQTDAVICFDENGGAVITWRDNRDGLDEVIYAQKIIPSQSSPVDGDGDGGGGGSASAETNIIPLIILGVIIGLAATVMVVSYSVRKKKKARELLPFQKALDVSRGFEVAGDTFRFFVRIENTLDLAITNVSVKIIPPHTLKLDKKSPSREFLIGDVRPGKFGTAIFYLFCIACADTEINAEIDYKDPEGSLQIEKMHPFPIMSCKFVKPRKISMEEFEEEYQAKEKKTIEIRLRADISDEEAVKMLRDRLTMSTVASSSNSLAMSGRARDGSDILLKSVIKEIEGVKTAVASVVSSNQYVTMGVLSDIMETFSEFRQEAISKFEVLEKGHEEIKETVIREARKILENQIAEYELLEARNLELQEGIQKLSGKVEELELTGDFSQANEIKQQIESLNLEFRRTSQQLEAKMDEAIENVDKIFAELGKLEDIELYLKKHLDTDWERLQTSWAELKEGTINRKQFIAKGLGVVGKRFLKVAFNLAGMFI